MSQSNNFREKPYPLNCPVIFGAPYEGGAYWRKGAKDGPQIIKQELKKIRPINLATGSRLAWEMHSLFSDDLTMNPYDNEACFSTIEKEIRDIVMAGGVPIMIGGDHSISIPALRAIADIYGSNGYSIIHIDAHSDTFPDIDGYKYHHGAVFRVAVEESLIEAKNIVQLGVRGAVREGGTDFVKEHDISCISMDEWRRKNFSIETFLPNDNRLVYLSFDIDVVDPAFAPGTGTPVPGGLSSHEALTVMRELAKYNLIGLDLVEVAPIYDVANNTSLLASYLIFEILTAGKFNYLNLYEK